LRKRTNDRVASLPSRKREGPGEGLSPSSGKKNRPSPNPSREREGNISERSCILTRRTAPREELIRLALGPDGQVAPDVRARAPGRGAWIGVGRRALDEANAKGKLKGALSRAFKTGDVEVPADLGERIETALRQQALDRLGLEARGGTLINGAERIEQAARAGKVHMLIHAADAGEDGNRTLDQAWRVGGGPAKGLVFPLPRTILSMALGRENVVHVALTDAAAARRVSHAIDRWQAFIDPDAGLDGAVAVRPGSNDDDLDEGNA
jgi:predicted RNA-binding protein YlxR (DUF448 family)